VIKKIALISLLFLTSTVFADDFVWIVGGGPDLKNSQVQIEQNVMWAAEVIEQLPLSNGNERHLNIFFTDGKAPDKDVNVWQPKSEENLRLQPLAMVYGAGDENGFEYRNNKIENIRGSTVRSELEPRLKKDFSDLQQGDRGLFIFNGHGLHDKENTSKNQFLLWEKTAFNVSEFSSLLNNVDNAVPMRFVFTQCYSGGFERLVHPAAADNNELVDAPRCGFFSEAADRQAEGCSSSIQTKDYRDYSTYFFAALGGKTRQGEALPENPDRNDDGEVSLYEAHLYTLAQAYSLDLPRSTSEVYLERWQPWYLRWFFAGEGRGNVYAKLANDLARELSVPTEQSVQRSVISKKRRRLDRQTKKLKKERVQLRVAMKELRYNIRYQLEQSWPKFSKLSADSYLELSNDEVKKARKFITRHDDWTTLQRGYKRYYEISAEQLDIGRKLTQFDKLRRLNKLARLRQQFDENATVQQKADYQRLLGCEKLPL